MSEYDYQRYFRAIRSKPELTPRAGMSWEEVNYMRELKKRAEEYESWLSVDGRLHDTARNALLGSGGAHDIWGLPNCGNDPDF